VRFFFAPKQIQANGEPKNEQGRKTPSSPGKPSTFFLLQPVNAARKPCTRRSRSIAAMVICARARLRSGGNPIIGIISKLASRRVAFRRTGVNAFHFRVCKPRLADFPMDLLAHFLPALELAVRRGQAGPLRSIAPPDGTPTHAIIFEWVKFLRPPPHFPDSFVRLPAQCDSKKFHQRSFVTSQSVSSILMAGLFARDTGSSSLLHKRPAEIVSRPRCRLAPAEEIFVGPPAIRFRIPASAVRPCMP